MISPKSIVAIDAGSFHHYIVVGEANVLNPGQFVPGLLKSDCDKNNYKYEFFWCFHIHRLSFTYKTTRMDISSHCTSRVRLWLFLLRIELVTKENGNLFLGYAI